jgi:hypothetical protein
MLFNIDLSPHMLYSYVASNWIFTKGEYKYTNQILLGALRKFFRQGKQPTGQ